MQVDIDLEELETLAAALLRLKFGDEEPAEPYFGSPRLATAYHRIIGAIISESEQMGDSRRVSRWRSWKDWSNRGYERAMIARYASKLALWDSWDVDQKIQVLKTCSAPFEVTGEDLEELRKEIEEMRILSRGR
ncbi:hypothetical protein ACTWP5_15455 [Streptomyces sp. 4N509B]|uniref:hypothetical protein n=1 Tax=Streptomyces sp. 4N509B TaxID=3457413 RepID=UPI003FD236A8